MTKFIAAACAALFACASHATSTTISVDAGKLGWYTDAGTHESINDNTLTGDLAGHEYRSFFEWTLPAFSGHVTGAHLEMALPYSLGTDVAGGQVGAMFDVSAQSLAILGLEDGGGHGTAIYADLGSGASYGGFTITPADDEQTFDIALDATAVSAINAAHGGVFAIGMTDTSAPTGSDDYFLFSSMSTRGSQMLVLDVTPAPEPSTLEMTALGALMLGGLARRRRMR